MKLSKLLAKLTKEEQKKVKAIVATKLPYNASFYIAQESKDEFVVYLASGGSKLPEWYKSFPTQKDALKFWNEILSLAAKKMKKL